MHRQVQAASDDFYSELGRRNYVTPTSYLELISTFRTLLEAKRAANRRAKTRYVVGLEKLEGSAAQVATMQTDLVALQPQLVATAGEVGELMARIGTEKRDVVEPKVEVRSRPQPVCRATAARTLLKPSSSTPAVHTQPLPLTLGPCSGGPRGGGQGAGAGGRRQGDPRRV